MRVAPVMSKILEKLLFAESSMTNKPIVFLFHPNECLDLRNGVKPVRRANNAIEHLFADVIRRELKIKNLGIRATLLLDDVIKRAKDAGFEFVTAHEYIKLVGN
ncbi:Uncharacterised protein [uncultured archaeon]|nr:Uncharacterised protein [uncultured archaeon]